MVLNGLDRTQAEVAPLLEELCRDRVFPNAVLFSGERCSGRMFAARAVCRRLQIPSENVIIVSDRNHSYRIRTAIELYKKHRNDSAKRFYEACGLKPHKYGMELILDGREQTK